MAKIKMVQNDTAPQLPFTLARADGTIPDLTGATVDFIIKDQSTGSVTNSGHQECTITDEAAGEGYYDFTTGDLPSAGKYYCDLQVTYANSKIETSPKAVIIEARAEAG